MTESADSNAVRLQMYLDTPIREHTPTLPQNRPLIGADLQIWRRNNELSSDEMKFLLSLASSKWGELCNKNANEVIPAEYEILIRAYDRFPDLMPLPPKVSAKEALSDLEVDPKQLSLLAGRESSSGHRWINYEHGLNIDAQAPTPSTQRIFLLMSAFSRNHNMNNVYINMVEEISQWRGLGKIRQSGTWKSEDERRHGKIKRLITTTFKKMSPLLKQVDKIFTSLSKAYEDGQVDLDTFDVASELYNRQVSTQFTAIQKYEELLKMHSKALNVKPAGLALPAATLKEVKLEQDCHFAATDWVELKEKEKLLKSDLAESNVRYKRLNKRLSKQPDDAKSAKAFEDTSAQIARIEDELGQMEKQFADLMTTITKVRKI
ncbi:hypothetical protein [Shewanella marisflavi]|uniref:hypothetical protein n=1 Tax=Shewanella marisflavi TaxID=260364 RepID=UPI003AAFAF32